MRLIDEKFHDNDGEDDANYKKDNDDDDNDDDDGDDDIDNEDHGYKTTCVAVKHQIMTRSMMVMIDDVDNGDDGDDYVEAAKSDVHSVENDR